MARGEGRMLDVRDRDAMVALAAELGEVDIVSSNATSRMSPQADPVDEVDAVAEINNLAATRMLRAFASRLRPGGRLIVVASARDADLAQDRLIMALCAGLIDTDASRPWFEDMSTRKRRPRRRAGRSSSSSGKRSTPRSTASWSSSARCCRGRPGAPVPHTAAA